MDCALVVHLTSVGGLQQVFHDRMESWLKSSVHPRRLQQAVVVCVCYVLENSMNSVTTVHKVAILWKMWG